MCVSVKKKKESGNWQRLTPAPQPDPIPEFMMHETIYDEKEGVPMLPACWLLVSVSPKALRSNSRAHPLGRVLTTPLSDPIMERGGADLEVGSAGIPKRSTLMMLTLLTQSTHAIVLLPQRTTVNSKEATAYNSHLRRGHRVLPSSPRSPSCPCDIVSE